MRIMIGEVVDMPFALRVWTTFAGSGLLAFSLVGEMSSSVSLQPEMNRAAINRPTVANLVVMDRSALVPDTSPTLGPARPGSDNRRVNLAKTLLQSLPNGTQAKTARTGRTRRYAESQLWQKQGCS